MKTRENFSSRLGFIFLAAGSAIGLGNVWRFPYAVGRHGGGWFVLLYLFFLLVLGLPVMLMELSIGRAGRQVLPGALGRLASAQRSRPVWAGIGSILFAGNFILLMFYTTVTGWLLGYAYYSISGAISGMDAAAAGSFFGDFLASPGRQTLFMLLSLGATLLICVGGLREGVEKGIKLMMGGLFVLLTLLIVRALSLPGAGEGVKFFLQPDWGAFRAENMRETIVAALAQAFFTLSLGVGSIAICGSYISRHNSLVNEGLWIIVLDTAVAISAGLIIFPCCAAYHIAPDSGPSLIFITLPPVFSALPGGRVWGLLFFIFLFFAALSTLVAVFENIIALGIDQFRWSRRQSTVIFGAALAILSFPCIWGFNYWKNWHPLGGDSNVLDLEDFIVSTNLLPLGSLIISLFCLNRWGWGAEKFFAEVNAGSGLKLPRAAESFLRYGVPAVILFVYLLGLKII